MSVPAAVRVLLAALFVFIGFDQTINFLKNRALSGGLLQVAVHGAGAFALDALRSRPNQAV